MAHLPTDAFEQYAAMGPAKTYQALAHRLGVSRRTVIRAAVAERWQDRLMAIEAKAREKTDERMVETLEAVNARHLRTLRIVQSKALAALANAPMRNGNQALTALVAAIRAEREIVAPGGGSGGSTLEDLVASAGMTVKARMDALRGAMTINVITGVTEPDDPALRSKPRVLPAEAESRWVPNPPNGR